MDLSALATAAVYTLAVGSLCVLWAVPAGTLLALLLIRTDVCGRQLAWIALGSQLAVPLYAFAGGWNAGFGLQGWFNIWAWLGPGAVDNLQHWPSALLAVAAIHALAMIPWVCLIISLGLIWTDRSQEESALIDGGWRLVLWRVLLPKLRIWLWASSLWCLIPILTEMVVSNLYQVPTLAEQIYLDASRGDIQPLTYATGGLMCLLPIVLAGGWLARRGPRWQTVIARAEHFNARPLSLGAWRGPLSAVTWLAIVGLVGLPLFNLVAKAGWQPAVTATGKTTYGWSFARLRTTIYESSTLFTEELYWSALLAFASTWLALATAMLLYRCCSAVARPWVSLGMLCLIAVPGPLVGMLVIDLLNRDSPAVFGQLFDSTLAAPILAQQFRMLPMAWLLIYTIMAAIGRQSWELSAMEGLSSWQRLRCVLLPQAGLRLVAAGLLLVVISMGELSSSILVLPPGVTTISMRLFEMLHFGMRHQDSGLCGLLFALGWCVSLAFWKTLKER